jgi:hypothetical protein
MISQVIFYIIKKLLVLYCISREIHFRTFFIFFMIINENIVDVRERRLEDLRAHGYCLRQ